MHVCNYQRILQPLIITSFLTQNLKNIKLSLERDYFWEVCKDSLLWHWGGGTTHNICDYEPSLLNSFKRSANSVAIHSKQKVRTNILTQNLSGKWIKKNIYTMQISTTTNPMRLIPSIKCPPPYAPSSTPRTTLRMILTYKDRRNSKHNM